MNKKLIVICGIMVFLAVFIPLASSNPDGLERVVETFGVEENAPLWSGLMSNYAIDAIANSYVSTLLAGALGTLLVLAAAFLLGKAMSSKALDSE